MTDEKIKCLMHNILGYEINDRMPNDYNSVVLRDVVYKTIVVAERLVKIDVLEELRDEFMKNTYSGIDAYVYLEKLILKLKEGQ